VPLVHCERCGEVPVPEVELPLEIPPASSKSPGQDRFSLKGAKEFLPAKCPSCGRPATRDAEMLEPWLGRAWLFLRWVIPGLDGKVDGFREYVPGGAPAREPVALEPPKGPPEGAAPAEAPRVPEAVSAPVDSGIEPAESAPDAPAMGGGPSVPGEGDVEAGPGEGVFPEDIDIFGVSGPKGGDEPPAVESELGYEPSGGLGDGEPGPGASRPDAKAGPVEAPPQDGSRASNESPAAEDHAEDVNAPKAYAAMAARPAEKRTEAPARPSEAKGPAADAGGLKGSEDDEGEEEEPGRPRLSTLRPFRPHLPEDGPPVACAFGDGGAPLTEYLNTRFLACFLRDIGQIPVGEPFGRYFRVGTMKFAQSSASKAPGRLAGGPRCAGPALPARSPRDKAQEAPSRAEPASQGSPRGIPEIRDIPEITEKYGADAFRVYLLFAGPPSQTLEFDPRGVRRAAVFLDRIWRQMNLRREKGKFVSRRMLVQKHFLIHHVTRHLEQGKFHVAVAEFMRFVNFLEDPETTPEDMDRTAMRTFIVLLSTIAPTMARELWSRIGEAQEISSVPWPSASEELIHPPEREFLIYVDGKLRDRMQQPATLESEKLESRALQRDIIREIVGSRKVERIIVVPQKLVSIVLAPAVGP
jgi:hypothetical protein